MYIVDSDNKQIVHNINVRKPTSFNNCNNGFFDVNYRQMLTLYLTEI